MWPFRKSQTQLKLDWLIRSQIAMAKAIAAINDPVADAEKIKAATAALKNHTTALEAAVAANS